MIKYYDTRGMIEDVKYTVRSTYLFESNKVVIESDYTVCGNYFGNEILKRFVDSTPNLETAKYIEGRFKFSIYGEIDVFDNDDKMVDCLTYGLVALPNHLVGVEIVKVEELEEE